MNRDKDFQRVLDEMFASEKNFTFEVVRRWQQTYPQFEREIAEAVNNWREFEFFALEGETEELPLSETAETAMKKVLAEFGIRRDEPLTDLRAEAEKKGVSRAGFLGALGVSETLMRKLERRNLKNIPEWVEKKIAEILDVSRETVRSFFDLPAKLSPSARYKSKNAPQTQPKESFAEAVRNDPELTAEEKRLILKDE